MAYNVDAKEIWLNYFNETLYSKGIINKSEYSKMTQLIRKKCHAPDRSDRKKALKESF